jgi:hypothetical protein
MVAHARRGYGRQMSSDDLVGEPVWDDVEPRPLTPWEQQLVDQLVGTVHCDELAEQARTSEVTGSCRCGCSSVRLASTGRRVSEAMALHLTAKRRPDHFAISGTTENAGTGTVGVTAHVTLGRLSELEIFTDIGTFIDPALLSELKDAEIDV